MTRRLQYPDVPATSVQHMNVQELQALLKWIQKEWRHLQANYTFISRTLVAAGASTAAASCM